MQRSRAPTINIASSNSSRHKKMTSLDSFPTLAEEDADRSHEKSNTAAAPIQIVKDEVRVSKVSSSDDTYETKPLITIRFTTSWRHRRTMMRKIIRNMESTRWE